jgi:hypothetical protein
MIHPAIVVACLLAIVRLSPAAANEVVPWNDTT